MPAYSTTPQAQETIAALWRLEKLILNTLDFKDVVQKIVESVLTELGYLNLGYRVIVLALVDEQSQTLKRISYSRTKEAEEAIGSLSLPFEKIDIPLSAGNNMCIKALMYKQPFFSHNVADVFYPTLTSGEILPIQDKVGIKTTMVYPILSKDKALGVMIFSLIKSELEVSPQEKHLLASFTDVVGLAVQNSKLYSSLEKTSDQLRQANEKLQQLDKLKDEFVSLASHELRTPLTAIKSYLWMVLQDSSVGSLNDQQKTYLDRTYTATDRLIKLVNDMLNVSRIESGRMTISLSRVNLVQLAADTIAEISPAANLQKVSLVLQKPSEDFFANIDPEKIKEVLINIIGNSLKFTPEGGSISISLHSKENWVEITITDTGKGIKKEDFPQLFQKFGMIEGNYLARSKGNGTGLGLYISKSIIEMHGGKISLSSEGENKGTTCHILLKKLV